MDNEKIDGARVRKGVTGEIVGSLIAVFIGAMPTSTYAQNVGAIQITRVGSRHVFTATGILLIILGLIPKIGAFIVSIPGAVLGSAFLIIYSMLLIMGLQTIAKMEWNHKNMLIVGISLALGVGINSVSPVAFAGMPLAVKAAIISPIILATVVAVILNLVINLIPSWVKKNKS